VSPVNKPPADAGPDSWQRYCLHLETELGERKVRIKVIEKLLYGWKREKRLLTDVAEAAQMAPRHDRTAPPS
jgi:hypothetical protein